MKHWSLASENLLFSASCAAPPLALPQRRPKGLVRILVAVASPGDIADYVDEHGLPLANVQAKQELALAEKSIGRYAYCHPGR